MATFEGPSQGCDSLSQTGVSKLLKSVLEMAYDNRWVGDFLFNDLSSSPFHQSLPLPPHAFSTSFSIDITQRINLMPDPLYPPAATHGPLPKTLIGDLPPDYVDETLLHSLYTPVATIGDHTVGYAITTHPTDVVKCMPHIPLIPPFVARFVLHAQTGALLLVWRGGTPPSLAVRLVRRAKLTTLREHFNLVVPDAPYRWPHLPVAATWMLSHIESDTQLPADLHGLSLGETIDAALSAPPGHSRVRDATPWPVCEHGALADGSQPLFDAPPLMCIEDQGTTASAFNTHVRTASITVLRDVLYGSFLSPGFRIDSLNGMTGIFSSAFTGVVTLAHSPTQSNRVRVLHDRFISLYYATVLAVTCDTALSTVAPDHPSNRNGGVAVDGAEGLWEDDNDTLWNDLTMIATDADGVPHASERSSAKSANGTELMRAKAMTDRERNGMLADRKRRNRLSAARSNERKRLWVAQLEQDVQSGRERVAELTRRRNQMHQENASLRKLVEEP